MGIEEFMKKHEPKGKRSKLLPYLDNILILRDHGYSQEQICEYLESEEGLTVTQATLSQFLSRHAKSDEGPSEKIKSRENPTKAAPSFFELKKKPEVDLDDLE